VHFKALRPQPGALLCALMLVAACGDDDDSGASCGDGTVIVDGVCLPDGDAGPQAGEGGGGGSGGSGGAAGQGGLSCGDGTIEMNGECVAEPVAPPKKGIGAGCASAMECESNICVLTDNTPGGLCSILGCGEDNPCPVGSTCYTTSTGVSLCMPFCEGDVDCREDYACQPLYTSPLGICSPSCTITEECPSSTRCNEDTGICDLITCDPASSEDDACSAEETCWPDTNGISEQGGVCLHLCDPGDPSAECLTDEVCQPLADDPANSGFCAPPVCSASHECPAGAICEDSVCQPPALCDEETECEDDDTTCVSGKCLAKCPTDDDDTCADIHPELVCADSLDEPACLPLGSFPGSACRANRDDACDPISAGEETAPMICQDEICLPDCTDGGTGLCQDISASLVCAEGIYDTPLCLPAGTFPGAPCGPSDSCAQDLQGNSDVDMVCVNDTCVVDCDEAEQWEGYGDTLCRFVDPTLTCSETAGEVCVLACDAGACDDGYSCLRPGDIPDAENACLPDGTFPGAACRDTVGSECDQNLGGNANVDMECASGTCVVSCGVADAATNDGLCAAVDPSLTCSETASDVCVIACDEGDCPTGYSCFDEGEENACLPNGTFPGAACRGTVGSECDQNLGGNANVDMECASGTCVVDCGVADAATNDGLCAGVDPSLTCSETAGDICVIACDEGDCPTGYSCFDEGEENACLPNGTFPGAACRAIVGNECDQNLNANPNVDMECASGTCVVSCGVADAATNDGLCAGVDPSLTCSETASDICVVACVTGMCPVGYFCLEPGDENACLPSP
jgi:hypothetical protein